MEFLLFNSLSELTLFIEKFIRINFFIKNSFLIEVQWKELCFTDKSIAINYFIEIFIAMKIIEKLIEINFSYRKVN